ncbi:GTP-binding protein 10 homolog [Odontomachus brunneus]|uniref:GTP-binding protein 10 homolog n=1 Tax=Odontomachus brunneus TaxID=486640 RepID=UPI0013F20019|nr:GTP-binding protein 10 homolog [Odontomachus brunneus]
MVFLTRFLGYAIVTKKLPRKYLRPNFIDTLRVNVRGGTGGSGLPRFGGIGGAGGNIYLVAKQGGTLEKVLQKLKTKRVVAEHGCNSKTRGIIGIAGKDTNIHVPCGISVYNENRTLLGELNEEGTKLLVAKGGIGGCEETGFCGVKGESQTITLDMKLIADVGLVGFPNAGKSTFLAAVSSAKPKIASYPFTTIRPRLGIIKYKDYRHMSVADLPGLIEGAHVNIGMGHKFLKHIERTKLLLFIVDIQGFQLSPKHISRSCLETVILLIKEIELYKPDLLRMPAVLLVNKMDTENADNIYKEVKPMLENLTNYVSTCPEEIQPGHVIQFESILPVSLLLKKKHEIETIKELIRMTLDKYEQRKQMAQHNGNQDLDLIKRIKRQNKQHAPTVI